MFMMTIFQTFMLMIAFASLVLSIISFRDKKHPTLEAWQRDRVSHLPTTLISFLMEPAIV
jgi:hypothetical protein